MHMASRQEHLQGSPQMTGSRQFLHLVPSALLVFPQAGTCLWAGFTDVQSLRNQSGPFHGGACQDHMKHLQNAPVRMMPLSRATNHLQFCTSFYVFETGAFSCSQVQNNVTHHLSCAVSLLCWILSVDGKTKVCFQIQLNFFPPLTCSVKPLFPSHTKDF